LFKEKLRAIYEKNIKSNIRLSDNSWLCSMIADGCSKYNDELENFLAVIEKVNLFECFFNCNDVNAESKRIKANRPKFVNAEYFSECIDTVLYAIGKEKEIASYENNALNTELGVSVNFGSYEWRAMEVLDEMVLLVLSSITDVGIPYNERNENTTWGTCSLRNWLNTDFYNRFSLSEKQAIVETDTTSENNQWYETNAGAKTVDKIFLLSISDVVKYFGDSGQLRHRPINSNWSECENGLSHAIDDQYNHLRRVMYKDDYTWWWLRSPGESQDKAAYVNTEGIIFLNGEFAFDDGGKNYKCIRPAIRPAMFVKQKFLGNIGGKSNGNK